MTEAEWLACADPALMLDFLGSGPSERKLRLFAAACCRRVWHTLLEEDRSRVEVSERYADGLATEEELVAASQFPLLAPATRQDCRSVAVASAWAAAFAITGVSTIAEALPDPRWQEARAAEEANQCDILRDVFGRHFHLKLVLSSWLASTDGTVGQLARTIYDERAFDQIPILADALEAAGCADDAILDHLRGPGPHLPGCWVVDLLLKKS
jgi:hypothetical protein